MYSDLVSEAQQKAKKLRDSAETFGKQQTDEALLAAGEEIKELKSAAKSREKEAVDLIISELI